MLCIKSGSGVETGKGYTAARVFTDGETEFVGIKETGDTTFNGKYVTRFKVIDDPCGNCKNKCRAKKKCPLYQEE